MITQTALDACVPLAKQAVNRGFTALPVENSPIAVLNHAAIAMLAGERYAMDVRKNQEQRILCTANELCENSKPVMSSEGYALSPFTEVFDETVKDLHGKVSQLVQFIPTVVNPFIKGLVEKVETHLNLISVDELLDVTIKIVPFPRFLTQSAFASAITKYADRDYNPKIRINPVVNEMTEEDVLERLKTGSVTVDTEISKWFDYNGTDAAIRLVNQVFAGSVIDENNNFLGPIINDPDNGIYNALALYLVGNSLKGNLPETTKFSNTDVKTYCDLIVGICGNALVRHLKTLLIKREQDVVVYKYVGKTVHVFEDTYAKFIEEGGKNEILQGALFSEDRVFSQKALIEKADEYESLWNKQLAMIRRTEKTRKAILQDQYAKEFFRQTLVEEPEDSRLADGEMASVCKKFNDVYNSLSQSQKEDLGLAMTICVCDSRFPGSPAKDILLNTRDMIKDNPELRTDDAATMGFAVYIADWIASLIRFEVRT